MVWLSEWGVLKNYAFFYGDFNRSLEGSLSNKFWRPRVDDYWRLLKGVEGAGNPAVLREPYKNIGPPPWNPSKNPRRRFKQEHGEKYFVWCNLFQREKQIPRDSGGWVTLNTLWYYVIEYTGDYYIWPYYLPYDMTTYDNISYKQHALWLLTHPGTLRKKKYTSTTKSKYI